MPNSISPDPKTHPIPRLPRTSSRLHNHVVNCPLHPQIIRRHKPHPHLLALRARRELPAQRRPHHRRALGIARLANRDPGVIDPKLHIRLRAVVRIRHVELRAELILLALAQGDVLTDVDLDVGRRQGVVDGELVGGLVPGLVDAQLQVLGRILVERRDDGEELPGGEGAGLEVAVGKDGGGVFAFGCCGGWFWCWCRYREGGDQRCDSDERSGEKHGVIWF